MSKINLRDGNQLYVREIGRGQPVLVLHGFGMDSSHWLPTLLPHTRKYRFIIPDLRGFGKSHNVNFNTPCILTNYAEDIQDIVRAYHQEMKLIGISMGAFTALQYHRLFGLEGFSHYMHIDQSPYVLEDTDWPWGIFGLQGFQRLFVMRELLTELRRYGPDYPYENLPETLRHAIWQELGNFITSAMTRHYQKRIVRRLCRHENIATRLFPVENWYAYVTCLAAYIERDYDMRASLPDITIPVTLVAGYRSEMYPWEGQAFMHQQIPGSKLVTFKDSGHIPMLDEPLHFHRALKTFLSE